MPLQLTHDRREDVGDEIDLPVEVEAVDRLHEAERRDLLQIFELLAASGVGSSGRSRRSASRRTA